jgi:helix-turn-helix protein
MTSRMQSPVAAAGTAGHRLCSGDENRLCSVYAMNGTKTHRQPLERVAFAQRLRRARIAAGHETMEAAARAVGIRSGVYWRHENGKQGITLEFVRLYARAFAVDPGRLAFGRRRGLT